MRANFFCGCPLISILAAMSTSMLYILQLKMDVGHLKHVVQTKNCVFVSQSYYRYLSATISQIWN